MNELRELQKQDTEKLMSEEDIVAANDAVLSYLEGLTYEEYMFAEYGVRVNGFVVE